MIATNRFTTIIHVILVIILCEEGFIAQELLTTKAPIQNHIAPKYNLISFWSDENNFISDSIWFSFANYSGNKKK